jgi:folate-binding protein YgfZ
MARLSPLDDLHAAAGADFLPYGPPDAAIRVVETFGALDFEYASLRKACVLFDQPHRATLRIAGAERLDFLNRMLTQELKGLGTLEHRSAFWLNRKGRLVADLRLCEVGGELSVDLDPFAVRPTIESLEQYLFAEDVRIADATDEQHRLALHGPTAALALASATEPVDGPEGGPDPAQLTPGRACLRRFGEHTVLAERVDSTGEVGLELTLPAVAARAFAERLLDLCEAPELDPETGRPVREPTELQSRVRLRRTGWLAVNIARIEAGTPLFLVDFGTDALPAETGLLHERVDFKKGCYLGQEVVARMYSLGKPKQRLVGLRVDDERLGPGRDARQPVGGSPVFAAGVESGAVGEQVGVVTSSTISPMLGAVPVCLAMVRSAHTEAGTKLMVAAEGAMLPATVTDGLAFWHRPSAKG